MITIRKADNKDLSALYAIAGQMQAVHERNYFERCLEEQAAGNRLVFIAQDAAGAAPGYVQLNLKSLYPPFRRLNVPEIQDLNVVPVARRQGLGARLVAYCEEQARSAGCDDIGISVGLYPRYGAAQRLYVRLGYMPDGAGVAYDETTVAAGAVCAVDDLLTLKLVKSLAAVPAAAVPQA
jgi:GNAT superfamily N-acetyltransferase